MSVLEARDGVEVPLDDVVPGEPEHAEKHAEKEVPA
jgi:hypothetical protein